MELFHVLNRGVDGRKIFLDSRDYARFVHDLFEFNDTAPAQEYNRIDNVGRTTSHIRERLVDLHGWTLMKNHFHLLLSERVEGGLTLFLRKMTGYARYFNERHERKGVLFQARTKKILIERHEHFLYVLHYLHLNPLDYLAGAKGWRMRDKERIESVPSALEYLQNYRWSSYPDYCGMRNFPSLITKDLFGQPHGAYEESVQEYLRDCDGLDLDFSDLE